MLERPSFVTIHFTTPTASPGFLCAQVKKKMSKEAFLKNNRGINDGEDLADEFMGALYDRIVNNEIKMKDESLTGEQLLVPAWQSHLSLQTPSLGCGDGYTGAAGGTQVDWEGGGGRGLGGVAACITVSTHVGMSARWSCPRNH